MAFLPDSFSKIGKIIFFVVPGESGFLIKRGDSEKLIESLHLILNDSTNGTVTSATCDITDWVDNAQVGQQLEIAIVGDGTDTQTQNGIK